MSRVLYALLPVAAGMLIAAQAPINARLRLSLASPLGSGFVSSSSGRSCSCRGRGDRRRSDHRRPRGRPWWAYLGGAFGALFVVVTLVAAPRVGVTATFVGVIVGQVCPPP